MSEVSNVANNPFRLTSSVVPRAYRLRFEPDAEYATFSASAEVDLTITRPTAEITLHALELDIQSVTILIGGDEVVSSRTHVDERTETVTLHFAVTLPVGDATLSVRFSAVVSEQLRGFYRSTYEDDEGVSHTIATTQFCVSDARRAFPCWDEPAFKATFQVTLVVANGQAAYSNTNEALVTDLGDGRREIQFAPTMPMSTYLVAFVIGHLESTPPRVALGTELRVVHPVGKGALAKWAMEVALHAIEFYSDYFAVAYPGDKIDLIAIPDFAFGAMENLGCVMFREAALLVESTTASQVELQRVAQVVSHELAHMWFGDLVTMEWWDGIWLNEAFATFMESLCTDAFRPEWKTLMEFSSRRDEAFTVDALYSTRSVEFEVVSPDECRGMFDVLTYVKGCAVLRMLEQYLGADVFRSGVRDYLNVHAYANTLTRDLWAALERASHQRIAPMMDTWLHQGGFPLITVGPSSISQEPFHFLAPSDTSAGTATWAVPVLTRELADEHVVTNVLTTRQSPWSIGELSVVNAGGSGFFRTQYDAHHFGRIAARFAQLDEIERVVMLSDTWALILSGRLTLDDLLELARGLVGLDEPAAWAVVVHAFDVMKRIVDRGDADLLARAARELFLSEFARLGWDARVDESPQASVLRPMVIEVLGTLGEEPTIVAEAIARFDEKRVHGDVANAIVGITMYQGRPDDGATCEARRRRAASPQDEHRYLFAPATSSSAGVTSDALQRALYDVRTQDAPWLIGALIANDVTGAQTWRAVTDCWDHVVDRFLPSSLIAIVRGVRNVARDDTFAREVRNFHENHPLVVAQQQVRQTLDLMDVHVAMARRCAPELTQTLQRFLG